METQNAQLEALRQCSSVGVRPIGGLASGCPIPGTPDFTSADSPLHRKDEAALARSVLDGFQSPGSPMAMPPRIGMPSLVDEQAIALVRYRMRGSGGK
ncbi:MAG: hypothetical protein PHP86_06320 [Nevskiales bacterium]|nr:hypothetical protein [Nevskiales bacterium]